MWPRVRSVRVLAAQRVALEFTDGTAGTLDLATLIAGRGGVFVALQDPAVFASVRVEREAGTLVWQNGADIDPDVLYAAVHATPRPAAVRERPD